jgi:hypothetical protein
LKIHENDFKGTISPIEAKNLVYINTLGLDRNILHGLDIKPTATVPDYGLTSRKRSRSSRTLWKVLLPLLVLIHANSISAAPHQGEGKFHLVFEEVGLMANSANYLLSKMSINMTVLEESVKDLQNSIKL